MLKWQKKKTHVSVVLALHIGRALVDALSSDSKVQFCLERRACSFTFSDSTGTGLDNVERDDG